MLVAVCSLMPKMSVLAEGGAGTAADPFTIDSVEDLVKFRDAIDGLNSITAYNGVNLSDGGTEKYFKLTADIDLSSVCGANIGAGGSEVSWAPIGSSDKPFKGHFNGNGHSIKGLYINSYRLSRAVWICIWGIY